MAKPLDVSDKNFAQAVLKAKNPVMVDFWAPWCAPCYAIAPILEELATEYEGQVEFARLNVDDSPKAAATYNIMAIPTLLLFKGGKPVKQMVGLRPKRELKEYLDKALE
jgi:thioredoxin 1